MSSFRRIAFATCVLVAVAALPTAGVAEPPEISPILQRWAARYDGPADKDDYALAVVAGPGGRRVYVTGSSVGHGTSSDYTTIAYNATSNVAHWVARHASPGAGHDVACGIAVDPDGNRVFVSGSTPRGANGYDITTIAYDAGSGSPLWVAHYNGPASSHDGGCAVKVSPDGSRVFVSGSSPGVGSGSDYVTIAYDAASGAELWVARYDGPAGADDMAKRIAVSRDGALLFVTGWSSGGASGYDYATIAYDAASGAQAWLARYDGPKSDRDMAEGIVVSPDSSRVYVTGLSSGVRSFEDYATLAYDAASGNRLWLARYNGPGGGDDRARAIDVSPDGTRLFVTGSSMGQETSFDFATIAYDAASGVQSWLARHNTRGSDLYFQDFATDVKVSPDGERVYVTGESQGIATLLDFTSVAYRATDGEGQWAVRFNGPANGNDYAPTLAVSPDGSRLYAAGVSRGATNDFATVAYCTLAAAEQAACLSRI